MTDRTVIDRLRSLKRHVENKPEVVQSSWGIRLRRPSELPNPTIPDQDWLEQVYLVEVARSIPDLLPEAQELVQFARNNRT